MSTERWVREIPHIQITNQMRVFAVNYRKNQMIWTNSKHQDHYSRHAQNHNTTSSKLRHLKKIILQEEVFIYVRWKTCIKPFELKCYLNTLCFLLDYLLFGNMSIFTIKLTPSSEMTSFFLGWKNLLPRSRAKESHDIFFLQEKVKLENINVFNFQDFASVIGNLFTNFMTWKRWI